MQGSNEMRGSQVRRLRRSLLDLQVGLSAACEYGDDYKRAKTDNSPIEIGRFDVAEALRFTRANEEDICRNELVALQTQDVSNHDVLPSLVRECAVWLEDLGQTGVELRV